jgi:hypothetical protein
LALDVKPWNEFGQVRACRAVRRAGERGTPRAVAEATGKKFFLYGSGGFGIEVLATLYSSASGER